MYRVPNKCAAGRSQVENDICFKGVMIIMRRWVSNFEKAHRFTLPGRISRRDVGTSSSDDQEFSHKLSIFGIILLTTWSSFDRIVYQSTLIPW